MSLRARQTLVFAAAMATLLIGLGGFIYLRLATELLNGIDRNLGARADALTALLASSGPAASDTPLGGGHRFVDPDEAFAQILDPTGRILDSTPGVAAVALLTPRQAAGISRTGSPRFLTRQDPQPEDADRLLAVPTAIAGRPVIAVVGETLGDRSDALTHLLATYAVTGPAGLILTCLAGWVLAGAALRPVEAIRARAAQLSHTTPTGRLPVPSTGDELTLLAVTLNDLLARLHAAVAREHRFVDDASHELRTPLAVLKAELDLAGTRPRTAGELQTTISIASAQTHRLITLAQDLLVLARARHDTTPARRIPTHLPTLLAEAIAPLRVPAENAGRTIHIDPQHDPQHDADDRGDREVAHLIVDIDPDQISRAIQNLVDNALKHGSGDITITTRLQAHWLQIDVTDHSPGIPEHLLTTLFDPFTHASTTTRHARTSGARGPDLDQAQPSSHLPGQPDRSQHTNEQPGAGLGLAIVRAIAAAHNGTATATNTPGSGAHLQLRVHVPTTPAT